jgi:hypothetical protein
VCRVVVLGQLAFHVVNVIVVVYGLEYLPIAVQPPPCSLKPINDSNLSVNLQEAYMLDSFNKVLGTPSNNVTDLLSKKVPKKTLATDNQTGMSFDSIQVLVSLDESNTHHLDELSLTADQQATNHKVLSDELLRMFTHYID